MTLRVAVSNAVVAAALAASSLLLVPATAADALPIVGPNQSRVTSYYATVEGARPLVGQRSDGYCGADYTWGTVTSNVMYQIVTCSKN